MRVMKKVMSVVLCAALTVSGISVSRPANAQTRYETEKIYISTDLVPQDANVSVETTDVPTITSVTNVQFDLDCNVDCSWKVEADSATGADMTKVTIDSMGHVEIKNGATSGSYRISAIANPDRIDTKDGKTTADCWLIVKGNDTPARATSIVLDKDRIESQRDNVSVTENGTKLVIDGKVTDLKLYTKVEPTYLLNDYVNFVSGNENSAVISEDIEDQTESLLTSVAATNTNTLTARAGEDTMPTEFSLEINRQNYTASLDCDNIPAKDKESSTSFNIRLNEDLDFYINDNEAKTLPEVITSGVAWTVTDTMGDAVGADEEGNYVTDLGTFTVSDNGKSINLKTPSRNSEEYTAYKAQIDSGNNSLTFRGIVTFAYADSGSTDTNSVASVTFNFSDSSNAITKVGLDFSYLEYGKDYIVRKETLNGKETDVYYFESDEKKLDLVRATQGNITGVRDFEEARDENFEGDDVNYAVTYMLEDVTDSSFGTSDAAIARYQNQEIGTNESNNRGEITTADRALTKIGTGYKKLAVSARGTGTTTYEGDEYILRFVSDASNMKLRHSAYIGDDDYYNNKAVIHVRQGEADLPSVELDDGTIAEVTEYNPFIEYTFTKIKGAGDAEDIATEFTERDTNIVRISGVSEGKVLVTAKSIVDSTKMDSYVLYVNDDSFVSEFEIDYTAAARMGAMQNGAITGAYKNIPLAIRPLGNNAGIPKVTWASSDDTYASVTQDGVLTTKRSTGSSSVTITATSVLDPSVSAEWILRIIDVPAEEVSRIEEKVEAGKSPVLTQGNENAASCQANQTFILQATEFVPSNATSMNGSIEWSSANEEIATVTAQDDGTGLVQTLKEGEVVITLSYTSSTSGKKDTPFILNVSGYADVITEIQCKSEITLSRVGLTEKLEPVVLPETATNKNVTYESKDVNVATVTQDGVVTATGQGTTQIIIASVVNPSVTATVTVTVTGESDPLPSAPAASNAPSAPTNPPAGGSQNQPGNGGQNTNTTPGTSNRATDLTVSPANATIAIGGSVNLRVAKVPQTAEGVILYSSSNSAIAAIDSSGRVTGIKAGTAVITVTCGSISKAVVIRVAKNPVIKLAKKTIKVKKSTKIKISNKAGRATVTYKVKKGKIASVSKKGVVKGKKKGKTVITVKVKQYGKTYTKKLTIKVK